MANFWDLPLLVRERIYRLNLVKDTPIDFEDFECMCNHKHTHPPNAMPCLMQVSRISEVEAMDIFLGENSFVMGPRCMWLWKHWMPRRHMNRIRNIVVSGWREFGNNCDRFFRFIGSLKNLESLSVKMNEQQSLREYLNSSATLSGMKWHSSLGYGPQVQLHVLHFNGIRGLRSIQGLRHVEFIPRDPKAKEEVPGDFGSIPGGLLDSIAREEIMSPRRTRSNVRKGLFRFLDLPPEIRNTIYNLLLVNPGVTYPTADTPTSVISASKHMGKALKDSVPIPYSSLAILETNHQIHNEAVTIFYRSNEMVFKYPSHLQAFTLSLEKDRLESITRLVLFYKDHNEGGLHTMDITMRLLRRMRGLKKFHLLLEKHMVQELGWPLTYRSGRPAHIRGAATLFTLRDIDDIKIRDLDLESRFEREKEKPQPHMPVYFTTMWQHEVLKHFNQGLKLAVQQGLVVKELYEDEEWHLEGKFPVLEGGVECGRFDGCSCE